VQYRTKARLPAIADGLPICVLLIKQPVEAPSDGSLFGRFAFVVLQIIWLDLRHKFRSAPLRVFTTRREEAHAAVWCEFV
jgi:hypothetical protein